jgi:Fe(3+) dicitrate transport protein
MYTGSDFELVCKSNDSPRNIKFKTAVAFFCENQFRITEKFSATPGVRFLNI